MCGHKRHSSRARDSKAPDKSYYNDDYPENYDSGFAGTSRQPPNQQYQCEHQYQQPQQPRQQLQQQQQPYRSYTPSYNDSKRPMTLSTEQQQAPPPTYTEAIDESVQSSRKTGEKSNAYPSPSRYPAIDEPAPSSQWTGDKSNGYPAPSPSGYLSGNSYYPQPLPSPVSPRSPRSPLSPALSAGPSRSRSSSQSRLGKPIAIPATLARYGSPFLRAYPPSLAQYHISPTLFLSFLDTLNRVAVKSPPLQVLSLAGNIVGQVPSATAQIVGGVVNLTAEVSAGVIQHGRTEIELRRANADIFNPRGLKVEIAKTEALARLVGMDGVLDADGKLNKKAALLLPLDGVGDADGQGGDDELSGQQRRLDAMRPWIAELDITPQQVPDIDVPTNAMSRLHVKMNERDRRSGEKKLVEKRNKVQAEYAKEAAKAQRGFDREMAKINRDLDKNLRDVDDKLAEATRKNKSRDVAKLERERQKVLDKYDRERRKEEGELQKEMRGAERERMKDDKEEKNMRKLNWLVIRELNAWSGDNPNAYLPTP
ncbi:hypothetical protein AYL99_01112 [Fonsecaea erecta]|uniref:Uncharacterized protein n=1 Tax=Fonsecaea erecta TaxID=1367422 RepID=A0A178ZZ41_9EURO|nr:hypothetical protein AYL99_01112 [Fonsecaea erecta]OAP65140.1 hypothetical protein AYL99_01112 [Fonsecaea erecta]